MLNYSTQVDAIVEPVTLALAKQQCRVDAGMTLDDGLFTSVYIPAARRLVEKILNRALFNQIWQRTLDNFPLAASFDYSISPADKINWPVYGGLWNRLVIDLPGGKTRRIVSVTYTATDGSLITLDPTLYAADLTSEPCRLTPDNGMVWPWQGSYLPGSVQITYEVGSYVSLVVEPFTVPAAVGATCTYPLLKPNATGLESIVNGAGAAVAGVTIATGPVTGASTLILPAAQAGLALTATYAVANCPADIVLAMLLLIGHFYRNPEATTDLKLDTIKLGVDALLSGHIVTWMDYRPC